MRVYIAAPLFSDSEKKFNQELDRFLKGLGFDTLLPQHDGYEKAELDKNFPSSVVNKKIFTKDISELRDCDILLMVLDGRVPDEGACVELGVAYASGKVCIGLKTDKRTLIDA
jgi:nucleoside 2-deoxyribosyltransferase